MNPLLALAANWLSDADRYERDKALVRGDAILQRVASELEAAWHEWELEELSVAQAAAESGYSVDHLRQLVRDGKLPDNRPPGSQGEIRIPRRDLPRKPPGQRQTVSAVEDMAATLLKARR